MDAAHAAELEGRERLRRLGLRVTRPRLLVYTALRELGGHHSVDDVVARLGERGARLPRMTVYNVVGDLVAAGAIMQADTGPGRALYEAGDVWHHHFVCRRCGSIRDVPCVVGSKPCLLPGGHAGGTVDEAQIIFRGVCDSCAALPPTAVK